MGAVFEAQHTKLKKTVAVKVLPLKLSQSALLISRFEREMEAVGKLDHPHIVRAMDAGEFQGTHFLVMEYVEGRDLSVLVKERGPRSVIEACEMIRQAALGLAHAHQHGMVHRDIKPGNLFATKQSVIKILDLGLALSLEDRPQDAGSDVLTVMGQFLGTPDDMAPEQWEDSHTADGRADLYSLGCTLFFLLTGRAPYADDEHHSLASKMRGHTSEPIPDLRAARREAIANRPKLLNDPLPDEVETLYRRLLAKLPADRLATADELAKTLQEIVKKLRAASPSSSGERGGVSPPVPQESNHPEASTTRKRVVEPGTTRVDEPGTTQLDEPGTTQLVEPGTNQVDEPGTTRLRVVLTSPPGRPFDTPTTPKTAEGGHSTLYDLGPIDFAAARKATERALAHIIHGSGEIRRGV